MACHYQIEVLKEVLLFGIDTWQVIQDLNEKHLTQC